MSEEKTFTKAELDAAVADANKALESKRDELLAEVRELKAAVRKSQDITPETLAAAEDRADKAEAKARELESSVKSLTKERDNAVKALETEQGAARSYALEAEITGAIAEGSVIPALVPAFKAMVQQQAKADLVDGKYAVQIGDKPARDYIKSFLDSDEGKAFKAAPANGGGGAQGGGGKGEGAKTVTRTQFDGMDHVARATFAKEGGQVVDA